MYKNSQKHLSTSKPIGNWETLEILPEVVSSSAVCSVMMITVEEPDWIIMHALLCYWQDYYHVIKSTFLLFVRNNILNVSVPEFEMCIY